MVSASTTGLVGAVVVALVVDEVVALVVALGSTAADVTPTAWAAAT